MIEVLAALEDFFMELSEQRPYVEKHPEIVDINRAYQEFLGKLYDSRILE